MTSFGPGQRASSTDEAPLVVVVDDDASVRQSTDRLIRSFGYRAEAFASGEQFLASGSAVRAACLVLDVRMADLDGLEVQRRLAEGGVRIPIVFLTGRASDDEERRARSAGAVDILRKPVGRATFLQVLRKVCREGSAITPGVPTTKMRKTGLDVLGEISWGTHMSVFYETKDDLLDTVARYCKVGLENEEFCLWVVSEPVTVDEAEHAMRRAVPEFDRYVDDHSIEIVSACDWYLQGGTFDLKKVIGGWHEKIARALGRGYAGMRVAGDTAWLEEDWKDFFKYEEMVNESLGNERVVLLCTYPLAACGATDVLDVVRSHQFAIAKRCGSWEIVETANVKQAKAEIKRLNEELEQRVVERTSQLTAASEALHKMQTQLAHMTRMTTLGEVTASFAHELNQPLGAIVNNANACLGLLSSRLHDPKAMREELADIVRDAERASAIIERVRGLAKGTAPEKVPVRLGDIVNDVRALVAAESMTRGVAIRTRVDPNVPVVQGDRLQLLQVLLNLIVNAMDAMSTVEGRERTLDIRACSDTQDRSPGARMSVQDCGVGLDIGDTERIFDAFYTTKPHGMGLGLAISRSIIEAHGGRLWAEPNEGPGATFSFTLPAAAPSGS